MRVYHFLSTCYAMDDLKYGRLKISRLEDLNDPFELLAIRCTDKECVKKIEKMKLMLDNEHGVICFSRNWSNPLLWSHYADKHKGICLGFDVPEKDAEDIDYVVSGLQCNKHSVDRDFMLKLLSTKYEDWRYEDEVRFFADLKEVDSKTGMYFKEFDEHLIPREIILGVRFDSTSISEQKVYIQNYANKNRVNLIHATLEFKSFRIVEDKTRKEDSV